MNLDLKPVVDPSFVAEEFDNETLIYNEKDAQAFYLNDTANAVLQICKEDLTIGQIIECLSQAFPEHKAQIQDDVVSVLTTLIDSKVVSLSDE